MKAFTYKPSMAGLVLAILFSASMSAPAQAQDPDTSAMANLVIQVQELQDELRTLRGMYEEQARELENLKRRQRDQYLDLDQRLSDVRSAQPVSTLGAGTAAPDGRRLQPPPVRSSHHRRRSRCTRGSHLRPGLARG